MLLDNDEGRNSNGWLLVAADHPALGRLYWRYCDESSVNAPDYYGITDNVQLASWIREGWRKTDVYVADYSDMSSMTARCFIRELFNPNRYDSNYLESFNWDNGHADIVLYQDLADLQRRSSQSVEDFVNWLRSAEWFDTPVPVPTSKS